MDNNISPIPKAAMSVAEFCNAASIGKTKFYTEVQAGRIRIKKAGRKSLIPTAELGAWLDRLPDLSDT